MDNTNKYNEHYVSETEKCEIVTLTQPLVDWLLSINTHNRTIKPAVVNRYADEIRRGEWYVTSQGIGIARNGTLLDGQHRLAAIKQLGYPPVRALVAFGLDEKAQMKIDTHTKRTTSDLLALAANIQADKTLPSALRILFALERRVAPTGLHNISMSDLLDKYEEYSEDWKALPVRGKKGVSGGFAACVLFARHLGAPTEKLVRFLTVFDTQENSNKTDPAFYLRKEYDDEIKRSLGFQTKSEWIAKLAHFITLDLKGVRSKKFHGPTDYVSAIDYLAAVAKSFK